MSKSLNRFFNFILPIEKRDHNVINWFKRASLFKKLLFVMSIVAVYSLICEAYVWSLNFIYNSMF